MTITTTTTRTRNRPSLARDDLDLARQIGSRLKAARLRAGLTQKQLAEPRYTKAYISALENGLIKPSMAALRFLARRLGADPSAFLADEDSAWQRLDAELRLASGDWQAAADRFETILDGKPEGASRGLTLLGLAEAAYRLNDGRQAISHATEALELLTVAHRPADARRAQYWLAAGHLATGDAARARILLEQVLAECRIEGTDPDLRVRILIALATVETYAGEAQAAIGLLEEARAIGADLDDRRRATLLHSLAQSYRQTGDLEGAIRTAVESLALFRAVDARAETASIENELAMIYLTLGNLDVAAGYASEARSAMERSRDSVGLAHIADTDARIALARGDLELAQQQAADAAARAEAVDSRKALVDALLTLARVARRRGDADAAIVALQRAEVAAADGPAARLKAVLSEWSDVLAERGDHAAAWELSKRALALA
ncbi:MAG TPA: tetratricopeptide repeat protein [Candidatus Limnocylindrales bacterium]|nr:tetratricopeptide repeat protein [Candidatus Limnocylindrales bacterium]